MQTNERNHKVILFQETDLDQLMIEIENTIACYQTEKVESSLTSIYDPTKNEIVYTALVILDVKEGE